MWWNMCLVSFESWELILQFVSSGLTKYVTQVSKIGLKLTHVSKKSSEGKWYFESMKMKWF